MFPLSPINKYLGSKASKTENKAFSKYVELTPNMLHLLARVSFRRKNKYIYYVCMCIHFQLVVLQYFFQESKLFLIPGKI